MFLKKRKNAVVLALIIFSSLVTLISFQNCSGGMQSQTDMGSLSNSSADNTPTSTPNPPPVAQGCTGMAPANQEVKQRDCGTGFTGTGVFSVVTFKCVGTTYMAQQAVTQDRCAPIGAVALQQSEVFDICRQYISTSAKAVVTNTIPNTTTTLSSLQLDSFLGDGQGGLGKGDNNSSQSLASVNAQIASGSQGINVANYGGKARTQTTLNCAFTTRVSCEVVNDGSSTISRAINMNPQSANYGKDEVAIINSTMSGTARTDALNAVMKNVFGMRSSPNGDSCAFDLANAFVGGTTSKTFNLRHVRNEQGFRCVQANIKIRMSAQTFVNQDTNMMYRTPAPSAPGDYSYINVAVNNGCWPENNLIPNPASIPMTANYGDVVAASNKWLVSLSPRESTFDSAGSIIKSNIGSLTLVDRTNFAAMPKYFNPDASGAGSTGDGIVSVAINDSDLMAVSLINRATGKGYVYLYNVAAATPQLIGSRFTNPAGSNDIQEFGRALALSPTGMLAVGAPKYSAVGASDYSGRVYIYSCNAGSGCSKQNELANSYWGAAFGSALSISGSKLAVGAPYLAGLSDSYAEGFVTVYDLNPSTYQVISQKTVIATGTELAVNPVDLDRPKVVNDGGRGRGFGASVSLYGSRLLVGAPNKAATQTGALVPRVGEAYYFADYQSSAPVQLSPSIGSDIRYGQGVALNKDGAFVGCPFCQTNMGQVFYHKYNGTTIGTTSTRTLFPLDRIPGDGYGNSVFATDSILIVGASNRTFGSNQTAGMAYSYGIIP